MEGQYGSAKAVAATTAQTITWNVSDIPNGGYAALTFLTTGVNNHLGATTPGVSRIRVKDNNMPLIDVGPTAIRTFMEAESPSNTIPVTNQLRWTLMTSLPGFPFRTGIPFGRKTSVEVDFNAANSSVTLRVPKDAFGEGDPTTWGYVVAVLSQEGYPSAGVWRVRDGQAAAAQWRFGGVPAGAANYPRIFDLADLGDQTAQLAFIPSTAGEGALTPDDLALVKLLMPR